MERNFRVCRTIAFLENHSIGLDVTSTLEREPPLLACRTGIRPTEGEAGVISLEQAFLNAGAKAVVASLWNVEDQSTTQLMEAFYRHLAAKEDKAAALRSAKRELLNANPGVPTYYWAGFVLVGEGPPKLLLSKPLQIRRFNQG